MKKKVFAVLVAVLLIISTVPAGVFAGEVPASLTVGSIQAAGVTDAAFAQAVYDAISAAIIAGDYTPTSTDVATILNEFTGTIDVKGKGIVSIAGVNLLPNAQVLDYSNVYKAPDEGPEYNFIEDLRPLGLTASRINCINFQDNPVHIWPATIPDVQSTSYGYETIYLSNGHAVYLFGGDPKVQNIVIGGSDGATVNGSTVWDVETSAYQLMGNVTAGTPISENLETAVLNVTGPDNGVVAMALPVFRYKASGWVNQQIQPGYVFMIDSIFYNKVTVDVEANAKGGFYLIKYKDGTENSENPVVVD